MIHNKTTNIRGRMHNVKAEGASITRQELLERASKLPKLPGCYLMLDAYEDVIYVGKAKNLKNRVSNYFQQAQKSVKTEVLVSKIRSFQFILTETETEAFVLENNLIKKHSPKYNIQLRDDKTYPYVEVNISEEFPRLKYVRRPRRDEGRLVFGPFVWGSRISKVIEICTKAFRLRDCSLHEFKTRKEPCLLYQMDQCTAPCVKKISKHDYRSDLELALSIFKNKPKNAIADLNQRMLRFSEEEKFEKAAMLRDWIGELNRFSSESLSQSSEFSQDDYNIDIISSHKGAIELDLSIYMVRGGILIGHKNFHFPIVDCIGEEAEEVSLYLLSYYTSTYESLPDKIVLDLGSEDNKKFEEALNLSFKTGHSFKVLKPRGKFKSLWETSGKAAEESQRIRFTNKDNVYIGLNKLGDLLGMKDRPRVLECYDVAIWQGKSPTASQVVFRDGLPAKKDYRHFHLKELPEGNNDFAMMKELFERRLQNGKLPDIVIVDGGISQVNMALKAMEEAQIHIPIAGIAKARGEKTNKKGEKLEERLIIPGRKNPYILKNNMSLLRILVKMRDEAHRFSRVLHHKTEEKRIFQSAWDLVPGIGPATKKKILERNYVSPEDLAGLDLNEIIEKAGVNQRQARSIKKHLDSLKN